MEHQHMSVNKSAGLAAFLSVPGERSRAPAESEGKTRCRSPNLLLCNEEINFENAAMTFLYFSRVP